MGPERDDKLKSQDATTRMSQELDQLLATSKRLVEEMQALLNRTKTLAEEHRSIVEDIRRRGE